MQLAFPRNDMPPMVRHAAVAYATYASEVAHPVEIQASNEDHLEAWLSKRLGMNLRAPKLEAVGFTLMGGRLLAGTHGPAAQFMYEDSVGRRLTLYVKTQEMGYDKSRSFKFAQEQEVNAFYWIEDGTGYVVSGNLGRADLLKVAESAHRQLDSLQEMKVNPKKSASGRPRVVVI
jgi:anti-sigma factor RsiW